MDEAPYVPSAPGRAALAELERVEWDSDELPAVLRGFHDDDPEVRVGAYEAVVSSDEPSAAVVPFLAAFAADPATRGRGRVIAALVTIAEACAVGDDQAADATRRAFLASRRWLEAAADLGPDLVQGALATVEAALRGAELREDSAELIDALDSWAESEDAAEEADSDEEIAAELEGHALRMRGAPEEAQAFALGRAQLLLRRAPALALRVAEASDHPDLATRARLLALQARALGGEDMLGGLRELIAEWLATARDGAASPKLTRAELLAALAAFPAGDVALLRRGIEHSRPTAVDG